MNKENDGFIYTYKNKGLEKDKPRRCQLKMKYGISYSQDPPWEVVQEEVKKMVDSGEIDLGINIVEREYQKNVFDKYTGEIVTIKFSVFGRKISFNNLRIKLFKKFKQFMRLNSDLYFENLSESELIERLINIDELGESDRNITLMKETLKKFERTRHLQIWHDGSTLSNHGHILFCINQLYDPAVFYTNSEYFQLHNESVNVQRTIEYPELYLVARCGNNDEQLAYCETRIEDLKTLSNGLDLGGLDENYDGIVLNDVLRYFHGDGCATAIESGNQRGGHYFCPSCKIHLNQSDNITCTFQQNTMSIDDIRKTVTKGKFGRINSEMGKTLPFSKMSALQIKSELVSRGIKPDDKLTTKEDLEHLLVKQLCGVKRVPLLLLHNFDSELKPLCLDHYEIALVEPMHDVASHIDNILTELPNHLKKGEKTHFKKAIKAMNEEKEKKRCCDRRRMLLSLTIGLRKILSPQPFELLKTLCEIQRIFYLDDELRTLEEILRLYNVTFRHFILMKNIFDINKLSAKMTRDKLFGKYKHNLLVHGPLQLRMVSGQSINVEDEERMFNTLRSFSHTTNNKPGHIIGNLIVRLQCEIQSKELFEYKRSRNEVLNEIHDLGRELYGEEENSTFSFKYIKKNSSDWQSHLERISDFLIHGENVWWKKTFSGITFFDYENSPEDFANRPKRHHFRSSNTSLVNTELKDHWKKILANDVVIPTFLILEGGENEKVSSRRTSYLGMNYGSKGINFPKLVNEDQEKEVTGEDGQEGEDEEVEEIEEEDVVEEIEEEDEVEEQEIEVEEEVEEDIDFNFINVLPKISVDCGEPSNKKPKLLDQKADLLNHESCCLYDVLGYHDSIYKFDRYKTAFKKKDPTVTREDLQDLQAPLQQQVLKMVKNLEDLIHKWDQDFMLKNDWALPVVADYEKDHTSNISIIYHKVEKGKYLLRKWGIQF